MDNTDSAADDIAAMITQILVKAFKEKEGREPTAEEVEQLIEELTEDRIESMMNGTDTALDENDQHTSDVEEDTKDKCNANDEDEKKDTKTTKQDVSQEKEDLLEVGKRTVDETKVPVVESNENGSPTISNKKAKLDVNVI